MSAADDYRAAAGAAQVELREKGSRFLALLRPAGDEAEAGAILDQLRAAHGDATHICWAWRLGSPPRERSADAGEPHGTAGRPMLQVLRGAGLSDVVAAVARWFGGVKLGKGGLARAYSGAVQAALAELAVVTRRATTRIELETSFDRVGAVRRLVRPPVVEVEAESYGATARLALRVERRHLEALLDSLAGLGIAASAEPADPDR